MQTDAQKLQTDLQNIHDKSLVTPADLAAVRKDFQQIQSEATTSPDPTKLATLQNDIQAVGSQMPTSAQATQLQNDFTAVVQSEGVTDQALITQTLTDMQTVVAHSGLTSDDLTTIATDMQAIQTDLGTNASGGGSSGAADTNPANWGLVLNKANVQGGGPTASGQVVSSMGNPFGGFGAGFGGI